MLCQVVYAVEGFVASDIRAGMSCLILVTQFMPSPVLSPRKDLFKLEKQGIESRG